MMTYPPHGGQDPSPDGPDQASTRPAAAPPDPRSSAPVSPSPAFGSGGFPPEADAFPPETVAFPPATGGRPAGGADVRHFRPDEERQAPTLPAMPALPGQPGPLRDLDDAGGTGDPGLSGAPPGPPDVPPGGGPPDVPPGGGPPDVPPGGGPPGPHGPFSPGPDPSDRPSRRPRGPMIGAILAVALILCVGGGISAWMLLRKVENGEGAAEPAVAVTAFLEAVYRDKDAGRAGALVCAEARDDAALTRKIDEIKAYDQRFNQPTFEWSEPVVDEQTGDRAVVTVQLEMVTADEKTAEQPMRFTVVRKAGWWICDVG